MTQTIWLKGQKMRTEMTGEGQTTIMLVDMDTRIMYMYMPAQNMAIRMNMNDTVLPRPMKSAVCTDYSYTIIGTEMYDGKSCLVVDYTVQESSPHVGLEEKGSRSRWKRPHGW